MVIKANLKKKKKHYKGERTEQTTQTGDRQKQ